MFLDRPAELRQCFEMLTTRSARLLNFKDYGFAVGNPADVVIINAQTPEQAVAEIAQPLAAFKNGRQTMAWSLPQLMRPRSKVAQWHSPADAQRSQSFRGRPKAGARNPGPHVMRLLLWIPGFARRSARNDR